MKTTVIMSLVVLAVIGGLVYMSMNKAPADKMPANQTQEATTSEQSTTTATENGAMMAVKEIVVEGSNFKFDPATITVKKGEKVKITLKNTDANDKFAIIHDFVIDELSVQSEEIGEGESTTFEFVADKVGSFEYYCSIGNHREMGMKGTLIVEE